MTHYRTWPDGNSTLCYCTVGRDHPVDRNGVAIPDLSVTVELCSHICGHGRCRDCCGCWTDGPLDAQMEDDRG